LLLTLDVRLPRILTLWLLIAGLACAARLATAVPIGPGFAYTAAPYVLLVVAPVASAWLALRWFANGDHQSQPTTRLAISGRWRSVSRAEAQRHPLYGTSGIMVSLLVGMLLTVPMRAVQYLASIPPLPQQAPVWLSTMHVAMSFDMVLFTSLYSIAFVAALRRVPLFPRLLVAIWLADITMQLAIASLVGSAPHLPPEVGGALHPLLDGNVKKVLISSCLWLPYLLLSTRVNVTYRSRIPDLPPSRSNRGRAPPELRDSSV
jgi:hypothetical protein